MKLIVAGSRDFNDYNTMATTIDHMISKQKYIEIVFGDKSDTDSMLDRYCIERGFASKKFNTKNVSSDELDSVYSSMTRYADAIIAFHDGFSVNTIKLIKSAEKHKLSIKVFKYK